MNDGITTDAMFEIHHETYINLTQVSFCRQLQGKIVEGVMG